MPPVQGELDAQPKEGRGAVVALAASLRRLGGDAGGFVFEDDGRFDLVAMLSAGPAPSRGGEPTLRKQRLWLKAGVVKRGRRHGGIVRDARGEG